MQSYPLESTKAHVMRGQYPGAVTGTVEIALPFTASYLEIVVHDGNPGCIYVGRGPYTAVGSMFDVSDGWPILGATSYGYIYERTLLGPMSHLLMRAPVALLAGMNFSLVAWATQQPIAPVVTAGAAVLVTKP